MAVVELRGIRKVYDTGAVKVEALKGIDLSISRGEFTAVMGSSGSGKSTLMNILGCLDQPTDGEYLLDGEPVRDLRKEDLATVRNRKIGFVFQNFHLLPRTSALENVELPLLYRSENYSWKQMAEMATEALERVGLGDRVNHTPNELSGGQQQRVAIARALVTRPEILLADEPTGNLDSKTSLELIDFLQQLNSEGITIMMVTHEPDIAQFTSRIVTMKDGSIRSDRPIEPKKASDEIIRQAEDGEFDIETGVAL
ncbi:MAG: ABC transporter ATP-binding protein [Balneolaceae bacterium]